MGVLEVEVEFKEDEHVVLNVMGVEVEFQGGREGRTGDLGVLEVEVEFKEDEHVVLSVMEVEVELEEEEKEEQVICGCRRSRCSSRRMNMWF